MPSHSHYVTYNNATNNEIPSYENHPLRHPEWTYGIIDGSVFQGQANLWRTSSVWWWNSFSIMNPYINVVYCVKE